MLRASNGIEVRRPEGVECGQANLWYEIWGAPAPGSRPAPEIVPNCRFCTGKFTVRVRVRCAAVVFTIESDAPEPYESAFLFGFL